MEIYQTRGTCARAIQFEVDENGVVTKVHFVGGCAGNTQGVARLAEGKKAEEVVALLSGIQCRGGTSCPDQLAKALQKYLEK